MGDGLGKPLDRDMYRGPSNMSSDTYFGRGGAGDDLYNPYSGRGGTYTEYLGGNPHNVGGIQTRSIPYRDGGPHRELALSSEPILRSGPPIDASAHSNYSSNGVYSSNTYVGGSVLTQPPTSTTRGLGTQGSLSEAYWHRQAAPAPISSPPLVTLTRPEHTIIIWDWDDTLMCSSAINRNRLPEESIRQLEPLLEQVLVLSSRLGDTLVVTNADDLWVYESTRRFAPRVLPLLSHLAILSARRKHEAAFPNDVFAWKRETFREVLSTRSGTGLNLVVLGDSPSEIEAAYSSTHGLGLHPLIVKTVRFKEQPACEELIEQLKMMVQDLRSIVEEPASGNRHLSQWLRPTYSGYPSAVEPKQVATYSSFSVPTGTYAGRAVLIQ